MLFSLTVTTNESKINQTESVNVHDIKQDQGLVSQPEVKIAPFFLTICELYKNQSPQQQDEQMFISYDLNFILGEH